MNTPVRQSALYNPDLEKYPYLLPSFEIVATRLNPCPGGGGFASRTQQHQAADQGAGRTLSLLRYRFGDSPLKKSQFQNECAFSKYYDSLHGPL